GEYRQLGPALPAIAQKGVRIEHGETRVRWKRIRERLSGAQRRAVLGGEHADLARRDFRLLLARIDNIEDVEQEFGVEAGPQDLSLRTVFAVDGNDLSPLERPSADRAEHLGEPTVADVHVGRGEDGVKDDQAAQSAHEKLIQVVPSELLGHEDW